MIKTNSRVLISTEKEWCKEKEGRNLNRIKRLGLEVSKSWAKGMLGRVKKNIYIRVKEKQKKIDWLTTIYWIITWGTWFFWKSKIYDMLHFYLCLFSWLSSILLPIQGSSNFFPWFSFIKLKKKKKRKRKRKQKEKRNTNKTKQKKKDKTKQTIKTKQNKQFLFLLFGQVSCFVVNLFLIKSLILFTTFLFPSRNSFLSVFFLSKYPFRYFLFSSLLILFICLFFILFHYLIVSLISFSLSYFALSSFFGNFLHYFPFATN